MIESLAARLLPTMSPPRRTAAPGEVPLFQDGGVLVTSERVVAGGRGLALVDVLRAEPVRHSPRMKPALLTLGLSAGAAVPAAYALLAGDITVFAEGVLVLAGLAMFGSIARLLLAEDSYHVVLHTQRGTWRVLASPELAPATRLAELIHEAACTARQRR